MAPLFSKVDLNKLWHDVQNEETLICAKFGNDLFNISKVIGRKKWPSFLTHGDNSLYIKSMTHRIDINSTVKYSYTMSNKIRW